jgi:hypothetical protein
LTFKKGVVEAEFRSRTLNQTKSGTLTKKQRTVLQKNLSPFLEGFVFDDE